MDYVFTYGPLGFIVTETFDRALFPLQVLWEVGTAALVSGVAFGVLRSGRPLRVRVAYADLTNGRTTVRIGQNYAPLLGELPQSASHVAFPLGFGSAGVIGWRFPGFFLYHDLARGRQTTLGLQLAVMKGSGPIPSGAAVPVGTGEASGLPQLEGRLDLGGRAHGLAWGTYLVGHVDWKALNGLEHSEVDSRKPQAVFSCRCQS